MMVKDGARRSKVGPLESGALQAVTHSSRMRASGELDGSVRTMSSTPARQ